MPHEKWMRPRGGAGRRGAQPGLYFNVFVAYLAETHVASGRGGPRTSAARRSRARPRCTLGRASPAGAVCLGDNVLHRPGGLWHRWRPEPGGRRPQSTLLCSGVTHKPILSNAVSSPSVALDATVSAGNASIKERKKAKRPCQAQGCLQQSPRDGAADPSNSKVGACEAEWLSFRSPPSPLRSREKCSPRGSARGARRQSRGSAEDEPEAARPARPLSGPRVAGCRLRPAARQARRQSVGLF